MYHNYPYIAYIATHVCVSWSSRVAGLTACCQGVCDVIIDLCGNRPSVELSLVYRRTLVAMVMLERQILYTVQCLSCNLV